MIANRRMSSSTLDTHGTAYLCYLDECDDFVGSFITETGLQYRLQSHSHKCFNDDQAHIDEDHHTCCFDDTWKEIDLSITDMNKMVDISEPEHFIIHQVMKSGEDNFSLISKHVHFVTNDLLVDKDADHFIDKYVSNDLTGKGALVCIGEMHIKYPEPFDKKNIWSS